MKKYLNISLIYAVFAMAGGVFYREFTKFNGFSGTTVLGLSLSSGASAAISGVAGIGHILVGAGVILLLLSLTKTAKH